jgi:methionine-rich copper-binding protein CopC
MTSRTLTRTVAILAVSTAMWAFGAATASAHSALESSNPADGSVVTEAPAAITLTFNEPLLDDADSISLNAADGTNITSTKVQPNGSSIELPWPADLPAGEYQAAFRVVSADGHPVTGAISFTYAPADSAASPSASSPTSSEAVTPESSATPVAINEPITDTTEPESTGGNPWLGLGIGVAIGLVLVVLFAAMRRRRS